MKKQTKTAKKKPARPKTSKRKEDFEQALEKGAAEEKARQEQQQQELEDYIDPNKSRGDIGQQEKTSIVPKKEIQACALALKIPFRVWSNIKEIPEIRLSTEEAEEWAEPVVDLLEYYLPGRIPEVVWIWFCFLSSTAKVIDSRIEMVHQHKKATELSAAPHPKPAKGPAGSTLSADQPAPVHKGAEPAEGYPKE